MYINDEIQKQVLPILAKSAVAPTTETQQRASSLLQMNPGQQVKAEILATLPNSLYLARIAGETYKLEIPLNVQPGETLEMTFVAAEPRIAFEMLRPQSGGESVQLSTMGKWLSGSVNDARPIPVSREPLLENPAQLATMLAPKLKAAVAQSGLFYESHLAQWAAGEMALEEILKEPQGKLSRTLGGDSDGAEEKAAAEFADGSTLPYIKEQMQLLHSGVFAWKGQAWPGQDMEFTVTSRESGNDEPEIEATLAVALKRLGGIEAKVRFGADGLFIDFVCERPGAAAVLKSGGERLRSALTASGMHLVRMVAKDGEA
jgi:hypothetical protein